MFAFLFMGVATGFFAALALGLNGGRGIAVA